MKSSKHNINESDDSDTLEIVKVIPRKRKKKNQVVLKGRKKARKGKSIYSDLK